MHCGEDTSQSSFAAPSAYSSLLLFLLSILRPFSSVAAGQGVPQFAGHVGWARLGGRRVHALTGEGGWEKRGERGVGITDVGSILIGVPAPVG